MAGWLKRKAKKVSKSIWASHKRKVKKRRATRKKARQKARVARKEARQTVATTRGGPRPAATGAGTGAPPPASFPAPTGRAAFWARHPYLADARDMASIRAHGVFDRRDLRSGVITEAEMHALDNYDSQEEWRLDMLRLRREELKRQAARNRDSDPGARLTMVYAAGSKGVATVKHVGFRPPTARPSTLVKRPAPAWSPPNRRAVRKVKRKDRVDQLVTNWKPQLTQNARAAMAADGNLTGAMQSLQDFAEQFPETRTQIHDHLGKMAEFGKGYADAMETFMSTLAKGLNEDNPGLPPEVIQHLQPLTEVGELIERACQSTLAAWEDYFAPAIKAAQDEHTPSKAALTN